jgi:hypothetical protein
VAPPIRLLDRFRVKARQHITPDLVSSVNKGPAKGREQAVHQREGLFLMGREADVGLMSTIGA